MAVQQILLYEVNSEDGDSPFGAVATDGETAVSTFSESAPEDLRVALAENFTVKVDLAKTLDMAVWESPIEVLRYNLMYLTSEVQEFDTFEAAQAAAQEAFGE